MIQLWKIFLRKIPMIGALNEDSEAGSVEHRWNHADKILITKSSTSRRLLTKTMMEELKPTAMKKYELEIGDIGKRINFVICCKLQNMS